MMEKTDSEQPKRSNTLSPGLTLEQVENAILHSGYPLQTAISELLRAEFHVLPEWGFRDRITSTLRTLDVVAIRQLVEVSSDQSRIRPALALLIECKQSDLPYVLFSEHQDAPLHSSEFPYISGLAHDEIKISTDDDESRWIFRPLHALELDKNSFIQQVEGCSVFSKCVRKGGGGQVELSGTEAYSNIMMPLLSAAHHFAMTSAPSPAAFWFDAYMVLPVAIIDAPMIAYDTNASQDRVKYSKWHRVYRNEPQEERAFYRHLGSLSAVDVVHRSFFETYLADNVMPFAREFALLAVKHNHELATGEAFAAGFGADSWTNIEQRIRPIVIKKGPPAIAHPKTSDKKKTKSHH